MEGNTTLLYYRDLTQAEKDYVDNLERENMRKRRNGFIKDERYKHIDPETIWYLKNDYINNWKYSDNYIFTRCECGSLDFNLISDTPASYQSRRCLYICNKCGKTHIEYN